jgi:ribonuclease HI
MGLKKAHRTSIDKATRYLGVYFNMGLSWKTQIEVLQAKFEGMYDRISHSKPSADMAVYCINAVINAALKFPLQVAAIPKSTLKVWDSKHARIVKKAAYLPKNTCPEMLFLPKDMGGKGLQSLQLEIDTIRVQSQMRLLNSGGKAGVVVRAAKGRFETRSEKGTIQYHTAEALKRWDMQIKCSGMPSENEITSIEIQQHRDKEKANKNARRDQTTHAFGDGATWDKEGVTGWGIHLQLGGQGGGKIHQDKGRTPGKQQNDASETYAILQSLLSVHTGDDIQLYCDNQGCVNVWDNYTKGEDRGQRKYATMWNRIDKLRENRGATGAATEMHALDTVAHTERTKED